MSKAGKTTDFGYQEVAWKEKASRVKGVFDSVADNYDLMNDLMSAGVHRLWKKFALSRSGLKMGQSGLDIAAGTGDLARGLAKRVGAAGQVVLTDINATMLANGRRRMIDSGYVGNIFYAQANAECLPFANQSFHCITIGFGLRNVTDKPAALRSMFRVLRPGGRCLVLEFSKPTSVAVTKLYDAYSFRVLPWLGKRVAKDANSYQYLAESIRMHPDQETLQTMMTEAGFEDVTYFNLSGGIVALHVGYKYD
ncbi:MAG: bifunctional demethylmenaquinone methyltransferase/2-methoxy-6-polyprenyl-1,4-benzoquinol methylase UbiE [Gammaproteobacteria bacterium]